MESPYAELIEAGYSDEAEELRHFARGCIPMMPAGSPALTKTGGIPDLPPEIAYPTLTGYSLTWKQGQTKGETEQYAQSAMQLVLQLDLDALAASGCDQDGLLPRHGMLWIFWSGEIIELESDKWYDVKAQQPDQTATHRVIYWDGDRSTLRPTPPPCPYYSKYYTEALEEVFYDFDSVTDFPGTLDSRYSSALGDALEEVFGGTVDFQSDYCEPGDKLMGHPYGSNGSALCDDEVMLYQFAYDEGCLCNLFFKMKQSDLLRQDFSHIELDFDMD